MPQSAANPTPVRILFVCLGNICRSPLAEGVCRHLIRQRNLEDRVTVDSCGTGGWHVGQPPDARMRSTAERHGVSMQGQQARQFRTADFERFDYILVMDRANLRAVRSQDPTGRYADKVRLFRTYDPEPGNHEVPDPYYGGTEGFEKVYTMVERTCAALLDAVVPA